MLLIYEHLYEMFLGRGVSQAGKWVCLLTLPLLWTVAGGQKNTRTREELSSGEKL